MFINRVIFWAFFFFFSFHSSLTALNIGIFYINGFRGVEKRAALVDFLRLKKAYVILLQETHSDPQKQTQWTADWKGNFLLSHGTNLSAGVAIIFFSILLVVSQIWSKLCLVGF